MGISVSGSAPADTTSRSRSGTGAGPFPGTAAQVGEEGVDAIPDLLATAQTPPADADEPDQLEASIDRRDVVVTSPADTIDEQRLDVGLEAASTGLSATSWSQPSRLSIDSVAPAGLG